jgi:hypothetical protein
MRRKGVGFGASEKNMQGNNTIAQRAQLVAHLLRRKDNDSKKIAIYDDGRSFDYRPCGG